jgi:chromosome segregation ATPase
MSTNIQDILRRIEKLKAALQEKNALLEERERETARLRDELTASQGEIRERNLEAVELRRKLEEEAAHPHRSEAFAAAERVEAITHLQIDLQKLREEKREADREAERQRQEAERHRQETEALRAKLTKAEMAALPPGDAAVEAIKAKNREIALLQQRLSDAEKRAADAMRAMPPLPRPQDEIDWESLAEQRHRELEKLRGDIRKLKIEQERLNGELDEKDTVVAEVMVQLADAQERLEFGGADRDGGSARLRARLAEVEARVAELEEVATLQMEQIVELGG